MEKTLKELKENPYVKGTTPTELRFGDVTLRVNSWRNLYQTPANYFYKRDSKNFEEVVFSDKFKTTSRNPLFIKDEHKAGFRPALIGNGIYMRVTQTLVEICTKRLPELLEAFGYNPDEVVIEYFDDAVFEEEERTLVLSQITDDVKFSNPYSFKFHGDTYLVKSWRTLFVKICKILLMMNEEKFEQKVLSKDFHDIGVRTLFSKNKNELEDYSALIGNGIYVDTCFDAKSTIVRTVNMLKAFDLSADDVAVSFKVRETLDE